MRQIDAWIMRAVARDPGADFQQQRVGAGAVLQMMAVFLARLEAGAIARLQDFFAGVGHQHHFAFQHIDEFVLLEVPVALAGPGARRQPQQIDAELGQPGGIAQAAALAGPAGLIIGRRIEGAGARGQILGIDAFGHGRFPQNGNGPQA